MKRKLMFLLAVSLFPAEAWAQGERVILECRGGQYYEDGTRRVAAGDFHCAGHDGMDAVAISLSAPVKTKVEFVVDSPVDVGAIQSIVMKAHEGKQETEKQLCATGAVQGAPANYKVEPSGGKCPIDWSGWSDVRVSTKDKQVLGAFTNYSGDRRRWASLWVWYRR